MIECKWCGDPDCCERTDLRGEPVLCDACYMFALVYQSQAEIEQFRKNDFDNLDFSKCSIYEKYLALLLLAVATCKDMEFLKIIRDKFVVGLENADRKEMEGLE